jgi:cation:H+ antiporter
MGDAAYLVLGLAVLLIGGDLLVRGAVGLAARLEVPALLISLTVVAFGTSAPELFVAVQSVIEGHSALGLGNIVGSNVANLLLVIGAPALLLAPISAQTRGLRAHAGALLVATAAFSAIAYLRAEIDFAAGALLVAGIVGFVVFLSRRARTDSADPVLPDPSGFVEAHGARIALLFFGGLVGLPLGAHLVVDHGAALASAAGMRESALGAAFIGFGAALPELATVMAAAAHKKTDVAIGNVIGSNIFNLLAIGGAAGLAGGAVFDRGALRLDLPIMIASALALSAFVFARRDVGRAPGLLLSAAYLGFIFVVLTAEAAS